MGYYSKCSLLLLFGRWQICTLFCTFNSCLIEIMGLYLHYLLLQSCNVFTCVCIYTVCNTIIDIQFIHKALGLNKPVLHLRCKRALHNDRVPDGSQSVSSGCAIVTPSSLCITTQEDWQSTQHVPCPHGREEKWVFLTWQQAQHCWFMRDKSQSLMCNLWTSHALYCCYVFLGKMRWGKTSLDCVWNPFKCGSVS